MAWAVADRFAVRAMDLADADLNAFLASILPAHGRVLWRRRGRNLVTDQGARWLIGHAFVAPQATIPWYVAPKGAGGLANADTPASHSGWSEVTAYSQTSRPALTIAAPGGSGRSSSNAGNLASITANASTTVAGVALMSDPAKNATAGVLYGGNNFASPRALDAGEILQVTCTVSF